MIQVFDAESGRTVMVSRVHGDSVNDVTFLPGEDVKIVSASDDASVALSDCAACRDPDAVIQEARDWVAGR